MKQIDIKALAQDARVKELSEAIRAGTAGSLSVSQKVGTKKVGHKVPKAGLA